MSCKDNKKSMKQVKDRTIVIVVVIISLLFAVGGYIFNSINPGKVVIITVNNEEYMTIPLSENKELIVDNEYGINRIVIKDGKVYVEGADCPDKTCVRQGEIDKSSESIICLPHKLSITISDK